MAAAHERATAAHEAAAAALVAAHAAAGAVALRVARSTRLHLPEHPAESAAFLVDNPLAAQRRLGGRALSPPPGGAGAGARSEAPPQPHSRGVFSPAPGLYTHSGPTLEAHKNAPLPPPRLSTPVQHPLAAVDSVLQARGGLPMGRGR